MDNLEPVFDYTDPFKDLGDYANSKEISMVSKKIFYPIQLKISGMDLAGGIRVKQGYFYELLSHGIYGGRVKDQKTMENELKNSLIAEPDISDENNFREIKSMKYNGDVKLTDSQIAKYCLLETGKYTEKKKIEFILFRNGLKSPGKTLVGKSLEYLVENLSLSTKSMVYLPFRVIFDLYCSDKVPRYDGDHWEHMSRLSTKNIKNLLLDPEGVLENLGVNLYGLEFYKRRFPENVFMNGKEITPFPVLIVKNKGNGEWNEKFNEFMEGRTKQPSHFNETISSFESGDLFKSLEGGIDCGSEFS